MQIQNIKLIVKSVKNINPKNNHKDLMNGKVTKGRQVKHGFPPQAKIKFQNHHVNIISLELDFSAHAVFE